ncbi:MAG: hypothetical protein KBF25_10410 [Chitinophagaceae bacterium]|jgi:hypothetical protein|nr:hypothetical protein [Bacteroidota bacterium]MBP9934099.1 hypothetical protein [Chitinophagaceae bacterium]
MKKVQYILVPVLAGLMFTACNTEVKGPSQAELDTQVEAKVKSEAERLKAECDNNLMTAAKAKADSIMAKATNQKAPVAAPKPAQVKNNTPKNNPPKQTTPPPPPPKPATIGNGKPKMSGGGNTNEVGNGKPKMSGTKDEQGKTDNSKVGNGKPKMSGNQ